MNYRHAFHAGNFADVVKHAVLTRILVHLREKPAAFRMLDTHAGAGCYDLKGEAAQRTGEWRDGIGRLLGADAPPEVNTLLAPYRDAVMAYNDPSHASPAAISVYPGSPALALAMMRPQDRLTACELEPHAARELGAALRRDKRANAVAIDGYVALNAYLPPRERRGLVVIDPPFEQPDEYARLAHAIVNAWEKWPTGIFLVWFPVTDRARAAALCGALKRGVASKMLQVEVDTDARDRGLAATGLLVIHPPWRLADELAVMLPWLAAVLAQGPHPGHRLLWLREENEL